MNRPGTPCLGLQVILPGGYPELSQELTHIDKLPRQIVVTVLVGVEDKPFPTYTPYEVVARPTLDWGKRLAIKTITESPAGMLLLLGTSPPLPPPVNVVAVVVLASMGLPGICRVLAKDVSVGIVPTQSPLACVACKLLRSCDVEILLWTIEHANSHSKTSMQHFARHGLRQAYNTQKRKDGQEEFLHQNFSMPNIFHDCLGVIGDPHVDFPDHSRGCSNLE